ncbi:hypothetical protein M2116_001618 [Aurantimicrobium minutum]|jgi:hypothetical protein|nr:hypothetical protein [Aurantimicrobium minutum]MDF9810642.1 hypothetical protein [Aurantimicrobium minutum]
MMLEAVRRYEQSESPIMVNARDGFTTGRFFDESMLPPFHMVLDEFSVE